MGIKIVFVTGKGGVGKSSLAAAEALSFAKKGQKTLLVELGSHSYFDSVMDSESSVRNSYTPTPFLDGADIALWSGPECLREYARHLLKSEALYQLFFENKITRSLINIAPALPELAVMGKITSGPRHHGPPAPYEVIVVDAHSTGHFLALMRAAPGMAESIRVGPMGEQSRGIDKVLRDSAICEYKIVTLAEELPMTEAQELHSTLAKEFGVQPQILLNKWLDLPEKEILKKEHQAAKSQKTTEFLFYLEKLVERQASAEAQLKSVKASYLKVPFTTVQDPREFFRSLAKDLT